jgi:asparaginyl-tRNA synthetase
MIEPEIAFAELSDDMALAEGMLKYVINEVLNKCSQEIEFLNSFVDKGLKERLEFVASSDFAAVSYTEAVEILKASGEAFQYPCSGVRPADRARKVFNRKAL